MCQTHGRHGHLTGSLWPMTPSLQQTATLLDPYVRGDHDGIADRKSRRRWRQHLDCE